MQCLWIIFRQSQIEEQIIPKYGDDTQVFYLVAQLRLCPFSHVTKR